MTRPFLLLTIVPVIAEYREIARGIMPAEWFVRQNDKVHGPFDAATVKQFAATNKIGLNTLIAQSADGPWHPASKVKGLFPDALAPQASKAPPPPVKTQAAAVADTHTSPPPAPSVPRSYQKGYAAQTLEPGEKIAFKTRLSDAVLPGPLWILLLSSPLIGISLFSRNMHDVPEEHRLIIQLWQLSGIPGFILLILGLSLLIDTIGKVFLNEYVVTNKRVVIRTGFFKRKIEEFLLPSVDSVVVEQGLGGQVAKYGTLVLTVGGNKLRHKYVVNPFEFCRVVKEQKPQRSAWS